MLDITIIEEMKERKTTIKYYFMPIKIIIFTKVGEEQVLARMWRNRKLGAIGGNIKWCSHFEKQNGSL